MKYLIDKNGNVFKAHVISGIPEGFTDITKNIAIDAGAEGLNSNHVEAELIAEVSAIGFAAEHWTNGTDTVYDANDIPVLTDDNGDPYLDPDYAHVAAVEAADAIPAHHRIKKTSTADQELRQLIMDKLDILIHRIRQSMPIIIIIFIYLSTITLILWMR